MVGENFYTFLTLSTCQKGQGRQGKKALQNIKWVIRMQGAVSGFLSHLHMGKRSDIASPVECQCGKYKNLFRGTTATPWPTSKQTPPALPTSHSRTPWCVRHTIYSGPQPHAYSQSTVISSPQKWHSISLLLQLVLVSAIPSPTKSLFRHFSHSLCLCWCYSLLPIISGAPCLFTTLFAA